jgi:hypothetical protein
MAYNSDNHNKKVKYVMELYREWKTRKEDIPDTRFVKYELPKHGFAMSYTGFINGYKNRGKNKHKGANKRQLSLF